MTTPIGGLRVLIIGKDVLVRSGLQTVLSNRSEIKVIGLVDESDPAEQMVDLYQPDVLIWDGGSAPDRRRHAIREWLSAGIPMIALIPDRQYASSLREVGV